MAPFKYDPLDTERPTIRLLQLHKGYGPEIECSIFEASFEDDDLMPYEALSYTWGDTKLTDTISVGGHSQPVTGTLYIALQYLRLQDEDRILWADGLCINQEDVQERAHQVKQLGNIYSKAERVIFWLGSPASETDILLESLKQLQIESRRENCSQWEPTSHRWKKVWSSVQTTLEYKHRDLVDQQRTGLKVLLRNPWFKRIWVLQEVAYSTAAIVCCGHKSVSAFFFTLAPSLLEIRTENHCQAVLDSMPGLSRSESGLKRKDDLFTLVRSHSCRIARDPRDTIFALLGLSSDANDSEILRVDYEVSLQQVLQNATLVIFGLPGCAYESMQDFILNFETLNTATLERLCKDATLDDVIQFLRKRGNEIVITAKTLEAAAGNEEHGLEIVKFFLEKLEHKYRVRQETEEFKKEMRITMIDIDELGLSGRQQDDLRSVAAKPLRSSREQVAVSINSEEIKQALERKYWLETTRGAMVAAAANRKTGLQILRLLLDERNARITTDVVKSAMGQERGVERVQSLLESDTEATFIAAISCGLEAIEVLRQQDEPFKFTNRMIAAALESDAVYVQAVEILSRQSWSTNSSELICTAASNDTHGPDAVRLLLDHWEPTHKIQMDVSFGVAMEKNKKSGYEVMEVLLIQPTELVNVSRKFIELAYATMSPRYLRLLQHRHETWELFHLAIHSLKRNPDGEEILADLLSNTEHRLPITPQFIGELAKDFEVKFMQLFLDHRKDDVVVTNVFVEQILRRGPFVVDPTALKAFLQIWSEDLDLTVEIMGAAAQNGPEASKLVLELWQGRYEVTEEVLLTAACGRAGAFKPFWEQRPTNYKVDEHMLSKFVCNGSKGAAEEIMKLLIEAQPDNVIITEALVREAMKDNYKSGFEMLRFLLETHSDGFVLSEELALLLVGSRAPSLMKILLEKRGDEIEVTDTVIKTAEANMFCGDEVKKLLYARSGPRR